MANSFWDFGSGTGGADPVPAGFNPQAMPALPTTPAANGGWALSSFFRRATRSMAAIPAAAPRAELGQGLTQALQLLAKSAGSGSAGTATIPQPNPGPGAQARPAAHQHRRADPAADAAGQ